MIKRFVLALSLASTMLAWVATTVLAEARPSGGATVPQAAPGIAPGQSFVIEPPMADYVRDLDPGEQREQIRDWAVLGTLTRIDVTPEQLAKATYRTPLARLPYLEDLYSFEYGPGRRAYLGSRVLLFRDADDPDPQATIGRLADRVRMENDELPKVVEVYLVDDQRDRGMISVERAPDVRRDVLFSASYGYVSGEARTSAQLSAWLAQIDDLTYAKIASDGGLVLGGRRFARTRTDGLTLEDVAAIYQAHLALDQRTADARKKLNTLPASARAAIEQHIALRNQHRRERDDEDTQLDAPDAVLRMVPPVYRQQLLETIHHAYTASPAPGFSLDPEWLPDPAHPEHPLFLQRLRAFAAAPCDGLDEISHQAVQLAWQEPDEARRTSRTVAAARVRAARPEAGLFSTDRELCSKLRALLLPELEKLSSQIDKLPPGSWANGMSIYHRFVEQQSRRAEKEADGDLLGLGLLGLQFHEEDTRVQCARYEGLAGTRVGMTLFYTDLLAKLWAMADYGHSAPIAEVPGFLAEPQMTIPKEFEKESDENPYTRFWFGTRSDGVSRSVREVNTVLNFEHRFSRMYAASSNPARPSSEVKPREASRRIISWWNSHFDEIADYEQEYHRQNQIMKWALVVGATSTGTLARDLERFPVAAALEYGGWQQANRANLRFSEMLPAVKQTIYGRECIPLLSSYGFQSLGRQMVVSGGVTTASRAGTYSTRLADVTKPLGERLSSVAKAEVEASRSVASSRAVLRGEQVTFENAPAMRVPGATAAKDLGSPRVSYGRGAERGSLSITAREGNKAIGEIGARPTTNSVQLEWNEGPLERVRLGKPELAPATVGREVSATDRLARDVVSEIARRRPANVASKLETLAANGKQLSPEAREMVVGALRRDSELLAREFDAAVRLERPLLERGLSLTTERGRIIVTRDITVLPRNAPSIPPTDLSNSVAYFDRNLRVAREGLLPRTGGQVASWTHVRGVKVSVLKSDSIGALADRFVETSTGLTAERADALIPKSIPPVILLFEKCDADHKTATTRDDC